MTNESHGPELTGYLSLQKAARRNSLLRRHGKIRPWVRNTAIAGSLLALLGVTALHYSKSLESRLAGSSESRLCEDTGERYTFVPYEIPDDANPSQIIQEINEKTKGDLDANLYVWRKYKGVDEYPAGVRIQVPTPDKNGFIGYCDLKKMLETTPTTPSSGTNSQQLPNGHYRPIGGLQI